MPVFKRFRFRRDPTAPPPPVGQQWWASPSGGGNGTSSSLPFKVNDFWSVANDDDTLFLNSGNYTDSLSMITPPSGFGGSNNHPIKIRSVVDGGAIIDGQNARVPVSLDNVGFMEFHGFNARNSSRSVIEVHNGSTECDFYRVIASVAADADYVCWDIQDSDFNYFEECCGFGRGRKCWHFVNSSDNTKLRCFGMFNFSTHSLGFETSQWGTSLVYNSFRNKDIDGIYTIDVDSGSGSITSLLYGAFGLEWNPDVDDRCDSTYKGTSIFILPSQSAAGVLSGGYFGGSLNNVNLEHCAIYVGHPGVDTLHLHDYVGTNGAQNQTASNITEVGAGGEVHAPGWSLTNSIKAATVAGVPNLWTGSGNTGARLCKERDEDGDLTAVGRWPYKMNQRLMEEMTAQGRTPLDVTAIHQSVWGVLPTTCRWDGFSSTVVDAQPHRIEVIGGSATPLISTTAFYISPTGSDGNNGTSPSQAWKTFSWAFSQLTNNSTLILRTGQGNYTSSTTGLISINSSHPTGVTLRAENERQAFIIGDGDAVPIKIVEQSGWVFDGLYGESADLIGSTFGEVMEVYECSGITIRRCLLRKPNRYVNSAALLIWSPITGTGGGHLILENDIRDYHRHGILNKYESLQNVFRRNYTNSRFYADIPGGIVSGFTDRGDSGIAVYPGSNHIIENHISENNGIGYEIEAESLSNNIKYFGCISINDVFTGIIRSREGNATNAYFKDCLGVNPVTIGIYSRGAENTVLDNIRIEGAGLDGIIADLPVDVLDNPSPSITVTNSLVQDCGGTGFKAVDQDDFLMRFNCSENNGVAYDPVASHPNILNEFTAAPTNLGSDLTIIPGASNLKNAGLSGADIGCNIVNKYEDGVLTSDPLWTSGFPRGATVTGVNDGSNDIGDVHTRLGK